MVPSHVGDLDMLRVRECEKVVLVEEELIGRYGRDEYNRVVPIAVLEQRDPHGRARQAGPAQEARSVAGARPRLA